MSQHSSTFLSTKKLPGQVNRQKCTFFRRWRRSVKEIGPKSLVQVSCCVHWQEKFFLLPLAQISNSSSSLRYFYFFFSPTMQGGPCWRGLMIAGKPMERKGRCVAVWRWKIARFSFCAFSPVPVPSIGRRCVDQWPSVAGPTLAAGNRRVAPSYCRLVLNMAILL